MKGSTIKQLLLYNYRYRLAYTALFAAIGFFLLWKLWGLTGNFSELELATVVRNSTIVNFVDLPLNPLHALLQWIAVRVADDSLFVLRLPSVVLAAATITLLYNLCKKWFGKPAALLTCILVAGASWFLTTARIGVGAIELTFWTALALYSLTQLVTHKCTWLLTYAAAVVGMFFAPFGLYAALAIVSTTLATPAFRARLFKETPAYVRVMSLLLIAIGLAIAAVAAAQNVTFAKYLLGIEQGVPSVVVFFENIALNAGSPVSLLPANNPVNGPTGTLFVFYFELVFILFGLYMLWRTRVNRLNLVVIALGLTLALASGLNDSPYAHGLLIVPAAICLTAGLRHFIRRWQKTFPKNPYARVAAFLPLGILIALTMLGHYYTYFLLWPSQPEVQSTFSVVIDLKR